MNEKKICCICRREYEGYGNNAEPVATGMCCNACNISVVILARIEAVQGENPKNPGV